MKDNSIYKKEERNYDITVIIPVFNAIQTIENTIESIIANTGISVQIICVDDESTDGTFQLLCDKYSSYSGFLICEGHNEGPGIARNIGLGYALGEYIAFCDADDIVPETAYRALYDSAKSSQADIVIGDFVEQNEDTFAECRIDPNEENEMIKYFTRINVWNRLFRREFITENSVEFPCSMQGEDRLFISYLYEKKPKVTYIQDIVYCYMHLKNVQSLSSRNSIEDLIQRLQCWNEFYHIVFKIDQIAAKTIFSKGLFYLSDFWFDVCNTDKIEQAFLQMKSFLAGKEIDPSVFYECFGISQDEFVLLNSFAEYSYLNLSHFVKNDDFFDADLRKDVRKSRHPSVSVVIPIHNTAVYLRKCLLSLAMQSLNDIEVICVDDWSSDKSPCYVKMMCAIDKRFVYIRNIGKSAGAARNLGLKYARGKYIIFLDSDDYFAKDMLLDAYQKSESKKLEICLFGVNELNDVTKQIQKSCPHLRREHLPKEDVFDSSEVPFIFSITTGVAWNKLFLREFVNMNRLSFMEQQCFNDVYFVYCALVLAHRISVLPKDYVFYRVNNNSSLQGQKDKDISCAFHAFDKIYEQIRDLPEYTYFIEISWKNYMISCTHYILITCKQDDSFEMTYNYICSNKLLRSIKLEEVYEFNKPLFEEYQIILESSVTSFLFRKRYELLYVNDENTQLKKRIELLEKSVGENEELKNENIHLSNKIFQLEEEVNNLNYSISEIWKSMSMRIGRFITYIPRMARHIIKRYI